MPPPHTLLCASPLCCAMLDLASITPLSVQICRLQESPRTTVHIRATSLPTNTRQRLSPPTRATSSCLRLQLAIYVLLSTAMPLLMPPPATAQPPLVLFFNFASASAPTAGHAATPITTPRLSALPPHDSTLPHLCPCATVSLPRLCCLATATRVKAATAPSLPCSPPTRDRSTHQPPLHATAPTMTPSTLTPISTSSLSFS